MDGILIENLISPITLAFLLGILATLIRSDLEIPEPVIRIFAIFLLFSIGLQGGHELANADLSNIGGAVAVTALAVIFIPLLAFLAARFVVGLSIVNAAGVAALYGSVSSVTFVVARTYGEAAGTPMEGYITGLVALMELGILVALFYGRLALSRADGEKGSPLSAILMETLRGRGLLLLGGGLIIGAVSGDKNFAKIEPFFVEMFRGVLVLFLLEMGMTAGRHLKEFGQVGGRMLVFGLAIPMINGFIVTGLATLVGLPMGSAFVLGAVAASASYIDAPAAVRATFPEANPSIYLTSSLGITFPFMVLAGVPLVWKMAAFWQGL
ncbi:MAG: sodium-dependent bicarbonate transport family permease [Aestuariivirga sp.]|uniref:sodium-dependent bicarbonate transport family permease n=1 Tax=Aestuariivirga sp. TaxID=2650926 RepID=UPI0038CF3AC0